MKKNNRQPWESALTEKTVYASGGFIESDITKLETDIKVIESRFPYTRESSRSGYLRSGSYAMIPYAGRFGRGYIVAFPRTHSSVSIMYYLDREQRKGV